MKFQFTIRPKAGYADFESMVIVGDQPTWSNAEHFLLTLLKQVGVKPDQCYSEIIYAPKIAC